MFRSGAHSVGLIFIILSTLFTTLIRTQDSITFSPDAPLCVGERVEMICYIEPPAGRTFVFSIALVSFNGSNPATLNNIDNDETIGGVDLTRYSANTEGLTLTTARPAIRLIIDSYLPSDSDTLFGCHGTFSDGSLSDAIVSGMPMGPADPPSSPVITSFSQTDISWSNLIISWSTPDSDRNITTYSVYRNATFLTDTTSNQYTDSTQLAICTVYEYSVVAISCAGTSTQGVDTTSIRGYTLSTLDIMYTDTSGIVSVNWVLNRYGDSQTISIDYTFRVNYTFYKDGSSEYNASSFMLSQLSDDTSYDVNLDNIRFSVERTVINVCMEITQHCGVTFMGEAICEEYDSDVVVPPSGLEPGEIAAIVIVVILFCFGVISGIGIFFILFIFCKKDDKGYSIFGGRKRSNSQEMTNQKSKKPKGPAASEKPILYVDIDHTLHKPDTIKRHEPIEETHYTTVQNL